MALDEKSGQCLYNMPVHLKGFLFSLEIWLRINLDHM